MTDFAVSASFALWIHAGVHATAAGEHAATTVERLRAISTDLETLSPEAAAMLDEQMVYSCAYWAHATDLDQAQQGVNDTVVAGALTTTSVLCRRSSGLGAR